MGMLEENKKKYENQDYGMDYLGLPYMRLVDLEWKCFASSL